VLGIIVVLVGTCEYLFHASWWPKDSARTRHPREHFRSTGGVRLRLDIAGGAPEQGSKPPDLSAAGTPRRIGIAVPEWGSAAVYLRVGAEPPRKLWPEGAAFCGPVEKGLTDVGVFPIPERGEPTELYLLFCSFRRLDELFEPFGRLLEATEPGEEPAYEEIVNEHCIVDRRVLGPPDAGGRP